MFEEVCLVCGKHLQEDGRAYCSDNCQSHDLTSPSISSASSALSSPHLGYAAGGDVPALVPSALGSALNKYRGRTRNSVSSSSASSTSWSMLTDDEEEDSGLGIGSEYSFQDGVDSVHDANSKSSSYGYPMKPSALSYARRPSGTNYRSTVPHLHRRTSSGSSSGHVRGMPSSVPIHSHSSTEDDEGYSDFGSSSRDEMDADQDDPQLEREWENTKANLVATKAKRNRNRASLPAYFSLLQMTGSSTEKRSSPVSSSSGKTLAPRASPPTPKLTLAGLNAAFPYTSTASITATPRGRRRATDSSRGSRHSERSHSRSLSRIVLESMTRVEPPHRLRIDSKGSVEQVFDWSSVPGLPRGRTTVRRNSSPPPKMMLSAVALEDHNRALAGATKAEVYSGAVGAGRIHGKPRGRARVETFNGAGWNPEAIKRSGLLDRERATGGRGATRLF